MPIARQKPVSEQVVVITGATSGIGLATALLAAEQGACVVLVSRNRPQLESVAERIRRSGGKAMYVVADVGDKDAVQDVADRTVEIFGGFDTWINNAGVSVYGRLTETPLEEKRKVFETNFWGMIHGCRAAVPHLRIAGGTLINVGSIASDRAIPLQGIYSASKHAIKGYTDALRVELAEEGAPIIVTLVKPGTTDTPLFEHAKSHMKEKPRAAPPVYDPELVARTILEAAERPLREVTIGGGTKALGLMNTVSPRLADRWLGRYLFRVQRSPYEEMGDNATGNLDSPVDREGSIRGRFGGHVMRSSVFTAARLHPVRALGTVSVAAFGGWIASRLIMKAVNDSGYFRREPSPGVFTRDVVSGQSAPRISYDDEGAVAPAPEASHSPGEPARVDGELNVPQEARLRNNDSQVA